jgi:hypothetical protein
MNSVIFSRFVHFTQFCGENGSRMLKSRILRTKWTLKSAPNCRRESWSETFIEAWRESGLKTNGPNSDLELSAQLPHLVKQMLSRPFPETMRAPNFHDLLVHICGLYDM